MRMRALVYPMLVAAVAGGCDSTNPNPIAGTYVASSFVITETGEPPTDVLSLGGGLAITIAQNNATAGTLNIPGELTGGSAMTFSMAGTAVRTGNTVRFEQDADTFVRDMDWTISGANLTTTSSISGVSLAITLTRQ